MPANIRVGGVRVDFSANDSRYQAVSRSVQASNARLTRSYQTVGRSAARQSRLVGQFTSSLQSSLIATIAYAAGVRALTSATVGSARSFLDWEKGLVEVQKTTNLTDAQTRKLAEGFDRLLTRTSALNRPLPVTSRQLLEIAEVAGQMNVRGVPNLLRFTETVSLLGLTTDLAGKDAANALGLIIANTDATVESVGRVGSVLTALGNQFRGGELDIVNIAQDIARSTAEFKLPARELLAFSAVYSQVGARAEKTGTVFQRSIRALINAASEAVRGDPSKLAAIADAANVSFADLASTIARGDFTTALRVLGDALNNLEQIGGTNELTRGSLLTLLFGGENPPVRIAEVLGVLAENVGELDRALALANEEWEKQIALLQEAGKFAEARALRLQVVSNQLESQARTVGESLTAAFVPLAERFKGFQFALVGVGTALLSNFGSRAIRRIADTRQAVARATQETLRNSRAAVTAALARRTQLVAEATEAATLARGHSQRIRIANALRLTRKRLTAETLRLAAANTALNATVTPIARISRAASGALGLLGGPLGAITTALSLGATAWLLWGKRADEATRLSEDLSTRLDRIVQEAADAAAGLSANQKVIAEGIAEIARLRDLEEALRTDPLSEIDPRARPSVRLARRRQADETKREIEELERLVERARVANEELERASAADTAEGLRGVGSRFREISLAIDDPTRKVREFREELERATQLATDRARFETSIASISQFNQDVLTKAYQQQEEIQAKLLELERDKTNAISDLGRSRALVEQTTQLRDQFVLGTDSRKEAQRLVDQAQKQAGQKERQLSLAQQALDAAKAQLGVDVAALDVLVRANNLRRNTQALNAPLSIDPPDLTRQSDAAEEFTRQIQRQVEAREREARQLGIVSGLRRADQAASQARFAILNRFSDAQRAADESILRSRRELLRANRELEEVQRTLGESETEDASERILAARRRSEEARQALAEARVYREELERQGPAALAAADAAADAAGRIADIQIDSASRLQLATDLAKSGVRSFEDALVTLSTKGKGTFKDFADAIISDLLRIIIRATITANLLRAIGLAGSGAASGGGLLGRFGLGGSGTPPTIRLHEGGIAGAETARRHRGPLGPRETIAILERGEEILTRQDPRHRYNYFANRIVPRFHYGGVVGGAMGSGGRAGTQIRVELVNESSVPLEAVQTTQRIDFDQHVVTVILNDVRKKGPITKAMSQRLGRPF